ncbi:MAG: 6-pyruvoyl tetrahydropterin synthase family protein [Alphaproteobacteria bacterium]
MFTVEVRDHIMIAHSLPRPFFGPAQNLHGATFVVDVAFLAEQLNQYNVVVDIGRAHEVLKEVLQPLGYANLDAVPELEGELTTTEFLCRYIHDRIAEAARDGRLGDGGEALSGLRVTLNESHVAKASYEGPL